MNSWQKKLNLRVQYKNKKTVINRIEKNMCKLLKQRNTSSVTDPYIFASVWPIFPMRTIKKANLKNKSVWCHQKIWMQQEPKGLISQTKMKRRIGSWRFVSAWGSFHFLNYGPKVKQIRTFSSFMDLGRKYYIQDWPGRKKKQQNLSCQL